MATRAELDAHLASTSDIVALARDDLDVFWQTLDPSNLEASAAAIRDFMPDLTDTYGDIAATVAADWFDELREAAGLSSFYTATLAETAPVDQVRGSAGWAIAALAAADDPGNDASALDRLAQVAQRLILQPARGTITASVAGDPERPKFARVPTGAETCAFCLLMASRGPVYWSAESAGAGMDAYHGDCDCVATPFWDGDPFPESYDLDALQGIYRRAVSGSTSNDLRSILAQMRLNEGIR